MKIYFRILWRKITRQTTFRGSKSETAHHLMEQYHKKHPNLNVYVAKPVTVIEEITPFNEKDFRDIQSRMNKEG